jgi:hypothetical protein
MLSNIKPTNYTAVAPRPGYKYVVGADGVRREVPIQTNNTVKPNLQNMISKVSQRKTSLNNNSMVK